MPKRGLAFLLANVMFWQPMWAQADGIVVATPGTSLGQAGNGVPVINIATPNGSGLSHNQFQDYNVGTQGVILNNVAAQTGATQLGGIIVGNPNLDEPGCRADHPQRSQSAAAPASCAATPKWRGSRPGSSSPTLTASAATVAGLSTRRA